MKKIKDTIMDNKLQIIEIVILFIVPILVFVFDAYSVIESLFVINLVIDEINVGKILIMIVKFMWNIGIAIILFVFILKNERKFNEAKIINNNGNYYHGYPYWWYWICAKILNFKKCNLILTPIYMQFKLVINNTFDEYLPKLEIFQKIDENLFEIQEFNNNDVNKEVNLIIEDTYKISEKQLPKSKSSLHTCKISRNNNSKCRYYSQNFINEITTIIRNFEDGTRINLFATTNTAHTTEIAKSIFSQADRGNIDSLVVFQQEGNGMRNFKEKGYKIY